jgi:hypothetical protein
MAEDNGDLNASLPPPRVAGEHGPFREADFDREP